MVCGIMWIHNIGLLFYDLDGFTSKEDWVARIPIRTFYNPGICNVVRILTTPLPNKHQ